jgi:hypothetical protein
MKIDNAEIGALGGLWRRSLIALPDGTRDTTTRVLWLQSTHVFADIRQPALQSQFAHAQVLNDLSYQDCAQLAEQQAFAGHLTFDGNHFEWVRMIDFQPKGPHADIGALRWEGRVLIEEGRDVKYIEHWHRDPAAAVQPSAAAVLLDSIRGIKALLVRSGDYFMFARSRALQLPALDTLRQCVAAVATVEEARALVDCEVSFGVHANGAVRIAVSTLPYRVGKLLCADPNFQWKILETEGDGHALDGCMLGCFP